LLFFVLLYQNIDGIVVVHGDPNKTKGKERLRKEGRKGEWFKGEKKVKVVGCVFFSLSLSLFLSLIKNLGFLFFALLRRISPRAPCRRRRRR